LSPPPFRPAPSVSLALPPSLAASDSAALDFDATYNEHFAFVWRLARSAGFAADAADDVVQDVFVVVHRRLGDYDGRRPVRAWIYGIVKRVVADHRRSRRRKRARIVPDAPDDATERAPCPRPAPSEQAENAETLRLVASILERLHPDKREILVLAQVEQMSVREIAECLELNVNTAYARLRAARRDFDEMYARHVRDERRST
jgi:RNA polymerase sigma-70 factor (ECF subfamily)